MDKRFLLAVAASVVFGCATTNAPAPNQPPTGDGQGLSCQRRVKVSAIPAEYAWVKEHYPGSKVDMQSLTDCDGSPTDELHITTSDGRKVNVFFDISSFF